MAAKIGEADGILIGTAIEGASQVTIRRRGPEGSLQWSLANSSGSELPSLGALNLGEFAIMAFYLFCVFSGTYNQSLMKGHLHERQQGKIILLQTKDL